MQQVGRGGAEPVTGGQHPGGHFCALCISATAGSRAAVRLTRVQGQQARAALKHVAEPGAPTRLAFRSRRGADQEWGGEGT